MIILIIETRKFLQLSHLVQFAHGVEHGSLVVVVPVGRGKKSWESDNFCCTFEFPHVHSPDVKVQHVRVDVVDVTVPDEKK